MIKIFAIAALPLLALSAPAQAAYCRPLAEMLAEYHAEYGETPMWGGMSDDNDGNSVIILTAPDGTWTMLITNGSTACMADYGHDATSFAKGNV